MDPVQWLLDLPTWLVLLVSALVAAYVYLTWNFGYLEKQGIKTVKAWPIIGSLDPFFRKTVQDWDVENYQKFGRIYGMIEGRKPALLIGDPDLIRQVTVKDFAVFPHGRDFELSEKDKMFGQFLSLLRGEEWRRVRNIMTPSFTTGKLKGMSYLIEECCQKLVVYLDKFAESGEPINARKTMGALTLDVIGNCAFGTQVNTLENPDSEFVKMASIIFNPNKVPWQFLVMFIFPKLVKWLPPIFPTEAFEFFTKTINQVIDMKREQKQPRRDFLQLMLEAEVDEKGEPVSRPVEGNQSSKKAISTELITAQSVLFLLAGHETTATLLGFALYLLALNPEVQDKLAAEVDEVFEQNEGKLNYEIAASMPYVDMVLCETLRFYPPAVRTERQCTEDGYELGGVTLKKGMIIGIPVYAIHHDPDFYPNPEVFDPERFTPEKKAKRNPFTYLPFGSGPRNCIGMRFALIEAKMALATVIRHYRWNKCEKTEIPPVFTKGSGLLQPKSLTLTLVKRKH